MDIDRIIKNVVEDVKTAPKGEESDPTTGTEKKLSEMTIEELKEIEIKDDDAKTEIYKKLRAALEQIIKDYLKTSEDPHASEGMVKCYLETWQDCAHYIGIYYFKSNRYMYDWKREREEGGKRYDDSMLEIGLELYESYCSMFRKQFFIYDACRFLGISKEDMYRLNDLHCTFIKNGHASQESSYRTALASGRSNVTAMAILLNHDYDYTRTTQVIHTSDKGGIRSESLPLLEDPTQDIVLEQKTAGTILSNNGM